MIVTSFAVAVAAIALKKAQCLKEEKTCYEMVYYFVFRLSQSSEIELEMLEFTQTTNGIF